MLSVAVILILVFYFGYAHLNARPAEFNIPASISNIFVNYIQFNSLANSMNFNWPEPISSFLNIQQVGAYAGQSALSLQCLYDEQNFELNYFYAKQLVLAFEPVALILILILLFVFYYIYNKLDYKMPSFGVKFLAYAFAILFLIYPDICVSAFSLFSCIRVGILGYFRIF